MSCEAALDWVLLRFLKAPEQSLKQYLRKTSAFAGPRINAAGRLDDATCGFRLLVGDDRATARTLATQVETQNRERRGIQARMTEEARSAVEQIADLDSQKVLVLAGEDWHPGVVGIVASKMAEEFHRPVILLARDGNVWKGSARSTAGLNIKAALDGTAEYLMRYGGHLRLQA